MAKFDGTNGDETLYGTSAADIINGFGGNDSLKGFGGADRLDGGAGTDTVFYDDSTVGVVVSLETGRGLRGSAEGDTLIDVENLFGSSHDDTLVGNEGRNELSGLSGNDELRGGGGPDRLNGGDGDDVLKGGGGADALNGGAGFDTADYTNSAAGVVVSLITNTASLGDAQGDTFTFIENLVGSRFADTLIGHDGPNVITGASGNDTLKGYGADDTLRGGEGDDVINGGTGADTLIGGLGNDTYVVDTYSDRIIELGGQGIDVVRTSNDFRLTEGADVERLETTDPNGTVPMILYGNSSGNEIIGNNASNIISGQGGADRMIGRGGNDIYNVDNAGDEVVENGGQGIDIVQSRVSYRLTAGTDVERLEAYNDLETTAIDLTGNANGNVVRGSAGNNVINGGDGRDDLIGLGGQDSFLFDTPLNAATNLDRVIDFNVADDTILLDQDIFSSSLGLGNISAGELVIGTAAQDANDRIIYDTSTGALFYDNDGVGGNAQVQFALLSTGLALTNLDFLVVA